MPKGEKLFKFLASLMLRAFYGTVITERLPRQGLRAHLLLLRRLVVSSWGGRWP